MLPRTPIRGRLGVDHPLEPPQRAQPAGEGVFVREFGERAEEVHRTGLEGGLQLLEEQPAEQP